jgi:hypothetical protein
MVDYAAVKGIIVSSFYDSASWPALTDQLHMLLTGNLPEDVPPQFQPSVDSLLADVRLVEAMTGIHCTDRVPRTSSFDEFLPAVRRLYETSRIFGDVTVGSSATCAQWKIEAKERYEGDFRVRTRNPILLIGNTYDGHTPLASAYNVSSGFEGSVVLEVNGYGVRSSCSALSASSWAAWTSSVALWSLANELAFCNAQCLAWLGSSTFDVYPESCVGVLDKRDFA